MIKDGLGPLMAGRSQLRKSSTPSLPKGVRFLIAHENLSLRKFIKGCLQSMGGSTILELVPTGNVLNTLVREEGADVLIVNGEIREMREWNLVKSIRSHPKVNKMKVIVVSGNPDKGSILGAIQAGVDDYIILPFSAVAFEDRIRTLFAKRSS
ncbi:MAG: response regulator [Deltaproteobacteria bacterium]|nr:response regulator [Deltaproteobacteria bacterium]